jgi:beta-1,4-galactosyltransferase 5
MKNNETMEADKKRCNSFSLSSAIRKGITGGYWRPTRCQSKQKIAIVIPFRDREEHLCVLLKNLIPILILQQLEFKIFVVEQV